MRLRILGPPLVAAALALTAGAERAHAAGELNVVFQANHTIAFTQLNGSPVGTTAGPPTVIASGGYTLHFDDSAGVAGPSFDLRGPGINLVEDLFFGEAPSATHFVTFQPTSTYTWRNDEQPGTVFTFTTSSATVGGPPPTTPATGDTTQGTLSQDIVGSGVLPFRGALEAIVYASGKVSLSRQAKNVSSLKQGRYTFSVDDESKRHGFTLQSLRGKPIAITRAAFVGSRDVTVALKQGRWFFYTAGGRRTTFFVVS